MTGGKGAGHNFWKSDRVQGHNTQQLESNGTKMADKTGPLSSISKWNDIQRCHDSCKALLKDQGVGSGPNPGNLCPFPKIAGIIIPLISIRNYPAYKNQACQISGPYLPSSMAHTLSLWIWINLFLTYHFVSHWILSVMRHQESELH